MGFGGGGSAGMTAHVHNNVPLQGGPLDFANDTIASLNVGSTTFSDGAALQELVIGNAGDSMVVNGAGTAPEWSAGAGAFFNLGTFSEAALTTNIDTGALAAHDFYIVYFNISTDASALANAYTSLTINGSVTGYTSNTAGSSGGAFANAWTSGNEYTVTGSDFHNYSQNSDIGQIMVVPLSTDSLLSSGTMFRTMNATFRENSGAWSNYLTLSSGAHQSSTSVTSIQMFVTNAQIMGNMTVMAFDY